MKSLAIMHPDGGVLHHHQNALDVTDHHMSGTRYELIVEESEDVTHVYFVDLKLVYFVITTEKEKSE